MRISNLLRSYYAPGSIFFTYQYTLWDKCYYSHVRNEETRTQKSNTLVSSSLLPSNLSSKFLLAEPSQKPSVKTFWEMQHSKFTTPEIRTKPREGWRVDPRPRTNTYLLCSRHRCMLVFPWCFQGSIWNLLCLSLA